MAQQSHAAVDLDKHLDFMQLDEETRARIRSLRSIVDRELPGSLDKFYHHVRANAATRNFFLTHAHLACAKVARVAHWHAIAAGALDERYAASAHVIGGIHARVGLEP